MKINQTSEKISDDRWKWTISVDGTKSELDSIVKVIYYLHPSFPNPVVEKRNRKNNFILRSSGWGTFVVRIEVHYKDSTVKEFRHRLVFHREKPKIFLSYSSSSKSEDDLIKSFKEEAKSKGWELSTVEDIEPADDWEHAVNKKIDDAQLFVLLDGETPSRFALQELNMAKQLGKDTLVMDSNDFYNLGENLKIKNHDDLLNAFKEYDFKLKGV